MYEIAESSRSYCFVRFRPPCRPSRAARCRLPSTSLHGFSGVPTVVAAGKRARRITKCRRRPTISQHATTLLNLPAGSTGVTVNELTSSTSSSIRFASLRRIRRTHPTSRVPAHSAAFFGAGGVLAQLRQQNRPSGGRFDARFEQCVIQDVAAARAAGRQSSAGRSSFIRPGAPAATTIRRFRTVSSAESRCSSTTSLPRSARAASDRWTSFRLSLSSVAERSVLPVEARLFNEAAGGTFGAFEAPVLPADAFKPIDWTSSFRPRASASTSASARSRRRT